MGSLVIEVVCEGVDLTLEFVEVVGQIVDGVEFVAPCGLGPLDAAIDVGSFGRQDFGRQDKEFEAAFLTFLLEEGPELASAIDLNACDGEGSLFEEFAQQGSGIAGGLILGDASDGPFGDWIISGEVLDGLVGPDIDGQRVDLDELARQMRLAALWQTLGVALGEGEADASRIGCGGLAAQDGHGHNRAARHQAGQDAPHGGDAEHKACPRQQDGDLALAPHRILLAQVLDGKQGLAGRGRFAQAVRSAAFKLGRPLPAIQGGARHANRPGRIPGAKTLRHGSAPPHDGLAPCGKQNIRGFAGQNTRRSHALSYNMAG